jgi:hypothetical protein
MGSSVEEYNVNFEINSTLKSKVLILPAAVNSEFKGRNEIAYTQSSLNVLKLFQQNNIATSFAVGNPKDVVLIENRSIDWIGPVIFFSISLISQNPNIVSICLNVLSSYIYDIFKGKLEDPNVRCSFVIEDKKKNKKYEYEGPVSGLKEIKEIING